MTSRAPSGGWSGWLALASYFAHVQEPELRIDIVRAIWNDQMTDTERHLAALAAAPAASSVAGRRS